LNHVVLASAKIVKIQLITTAHYSNVLTPLLFLHQQR